jgi:hypothetical protein
MGWNDRLPEDPNIPYESPQDRDDYDAWAEYVEACRLEAETTAAGLTSQTVDPGRSKLSKSNAAENATRAAIDLFMTKFIGKEQ